MADFDHDFVTWFHEASPETLAVLATVALIIGLLLLIVWRLGTVLRRAETLQREEYRRWREEAGRDAVDLRDDIASVQQSASQLLVTSVAELGRGQRDGLIGLEQRIAHQVERSEFHQDTLRQEIERRLSGFQGTVDKRLDDMRRVVDDTLQTTLERRLGESFRQVSDQLEAVQKGLGEMQTLATGVGDLKRALGNVKIRGTWGEVQLGALLEEILTLGQFERNVRIGPSSDSVVEYAVRLPAADGEGLWMPIDSKFPQEDYLRLQQAADAGDPAEVASASAALARSLKQSAREIADKYLDPPRTTDFALMFLPTEGLYAESLRHSGLVETLQRECRVVVAGPTSLAAILNSLRMGFRTLAIEKRSSEVWRVLAAVKSEFERFGEHLVRVRRQLDSAAKSIDQTGTRTRAMARKLDQVETLPEDDARALFEFDDVKVDDMIPGMKSGEPNPDNNK
ncbi:MAG: hypothetical protein DHS20C01_10690 [marine bacterium B5-7]|nr:MAG: hypothetical protein DHS20C01_10690 [marine bacterium B5-7]